MFGHGIAETSLKELEFVNSRSAKDASKNIIYFLKLLISVENNIYYSN